VTLFPSRLSRAISCIALIVVEADVDVHMLQADAHAEVHG